MTDAVQNRQKKKSSWLVMKKLQLMIDNNDLRPGDRLPSERILSIKFNVSRLAIREAIQSLVNGGLLKTIQGSGTFVVKVNESVDLTGNLTQLISETDEFCNEEVFEAIILLQMIVTRFAAKRAKGKDLADLAEVLVEMLTKPDSPGEYLAHHLSFNQKIAVAARNRVLSEMLNMLISVYFECNQPNYGTLDFKESIKSHHEIYQAIRQKDPEGASQLVREQLLRLKSSQKLDT